MGAQVPQGCRVWAQGVGQRRPFFSFAPEERWLIYTTNGIESENTWLRKIIKARPHFPATTRPPTKKPLVCICAESILIGADVIYGVLKPAKSTPQLISSSRGSGAFSRSTIRRVARRLSQAGKPARGRSEGDTAPFLPVGDAGSRVSRPTHGHQRCEEACTATRERVVPLWAIAIRLEQCVFNGTEFLAPF